MRQLTIKQKKVLDQALIDYKDLNIKTYEDLPFSVWDKLTAINDTEILWSEVNRYINDKFWETN